MISTWKLGSECLEIKQDAQRHQFEFPKVKLIALETVPCYSKIYRACVVDSVLWYIHRQACLSMITNTLCIHVSTQ